MRISTKGEYGLRALFDMAQRYGQGPVQSHEIARRQGIDENYLNQILILLRKAGLIESIRGPQGGHMLARPPQQIALSEVIIVLEGPILPTDSARENASPDEPGDQALIREVWDELRATVETFLGGLTLDDLCQRKRQREGQVMYYI
jgi:Rrf2 family transcriptional regulator, cysteine metabolism repressor